MTPDVGRLHGRGTFRALSRPDGRGSSGPLHVAFLANTLANAPESGRDARVGYAIGKTHGNAVRRNRLRRRLRAAVAAVPALAPGDYLLRAAPAAAELPFTLMVDAVRGATGAAVANAAARTARSARGSSHGH